MYSGSCSRRTPAAPSFCSLTIFTGCGYFLGYVTRERRESFETDSLAALVILVAAVTVDEILLNNVGSFPDR